MVPKWTHFRPPKWVSQNGPILSTFGQVPIRSPTGLEDPGPRKITQGAFFVLMPLDPKIGMCPKTGFSTPKITDLSYWPKGPQNVQFPCPFYAILSHIRDQRVRAPDPKWGHPGPQIRPGSGTPRGPQMANVHHGHHDVINVHQK